MTGWLLVILHLYGGGGVPVTTIPFAAEQTCQAAAGRLANHPQTDQYAFVCIETDGEETE